MNTTAARKSPAGIILVLGGGLFALLLLLSLLAFSGRVHFSFIPGHFGRQAQEMGYTFGLYHSEDDKAYEQTRADFADWIMARGFTPCPSPGGMAAWSGMHSTGDTQQWYQMPVGSNLLRLRITTNHQNGNSISADTDDGGYYTPAELADMHRREVTLWNEMIAWFETHSKANVFLERPDMKDWYSKGRAGINKAYSK